MKCTMELRGGWRKLENSLVRDLGACLVGVRRGNSDVETEGAVSSRALFVCIVERRVVEMLQLFYNP